jgi:hypothetical protein
MVTLSGFVAGVLVAARGAGAASETPACAATTEGAAQAIAAAMHQWRY